MNEKIARELASLTDELTAPAVVELTDAEISAVAGGLYAGPELADSASAR